MSKLQRKEDWWKLQKLLKNKGIRIEFDSPHSLFTSELHLDIFSLERHIPHYNGEECTYKGKPNYSMAMAMEEEWGAEIHDLVKRLI